MKKVLVLIWTIVLIYTVYTLYNYQNESKNNKRIYEELRRNNNEEASYQENLDTNHFGIIDIYNKENKINIMERYESILLINQEILGWINVPNTKIDYPVVRSEDNEFYLYNNIYKEPSKAGTIFMDYRNSGTVNERHTILYGHNMKNGSMFGDLIKYKQADFLYENLIIEFNTLYQDVKWEIFSVYITSKDFYYIKTEFDNIFDYGNFLEMLKEKSLYEIETEVSVGDQILTLSTCSYEFDNARLVIHARRIIERENT